MFGLKSRSHEPEFHEPAAAGELAVGAPRIIETLIPAAKLNRRGRHLTFSVDQTGLQMAASATSLRQTHILDIHKTYFPANSDNDLAKTTFVTRTVDEYVRKFGGRRPFISCSVTGGETAFRTFTMPSLKGKGFASAVGFEAKKQLPFPVSDCHYDFRPIYRTRTGLNESIRVSLLAATKRLIGEHLAPFEQLGIDVDHVFHAQDIIGGLLTCLPDFSEDHHYTLVNVERTRTEIAYYRGSNLEFYHLCSVGSSFLANRNDLTIFEYFAESLAGEIQNSLDYYSGQHTGQFNTRIYIYGDLAYTDELIDLLHDHFGYEFRRFPTEELSRELGNADSLAVCLPVLAASLSKVKMANLLPAERLERVRLKRRARAGAFGLAGLVVFLGLAWLGLRGDLTARNGQLANVTSEVTSFKSSQLYDTYNRLKLQIAESQAYLDKVKPVPTYLSLSLKELSRITPASIRLSGFDYKNDSPDRNLVLQGVVTPGTVPPEVLLAEFVENLSGSPFYDKVVVIGYSKRSVPSGIEMDFQIGMKEKI